MRHFSLLLLFAAFVAQPLRAASENLVSNPGFEGGAMQSGLPKGGWWVAKSVGTPVVTVDHSAAHSGKSSLRFSAEAAEKCVLVSEKIPVTPGDALQFETWVRGTNLPPGKTTAYAGIAFRQTDGKVVLRRYFSLDALSEQWSRISGAAEAPATAAFAEVHLGYTNGPGTVWYDDVSAVITNALSLSLLEGAKPWQGPQSITVRAVNHQNALFRGSIETRIGGAKSSTPVKLAAKSEVKIELPITLQGVGQHAYKIDLLDATGAGVREIHGKFRTQPPLVLLPPCPYCVAQTANGETNVMLDFVVNVAPAQLPGLKIAASIAGPSGHAAQTLAADAAGGEPTELRGTIPLSNIGILNVSAKLTDAAGREIGAAESAVHVVAPGSAKVTMGPDGFLRVAGQREFPIGLYNSAHDEELAAAGFNATHNYNVAYGDAAPAINPNDQELADLLDKCAASGLRMMVELPREAVSKGNWAQVRRRIETFRDHPGLLCWGSEERVARGETSPANISKLYRLIKELDPNHPLVLGDTRDVIEKLMVDRRDFFPDASMDAGIWWWYPIPGDTMDPPSWLTTTHSKKPLWIAIQAYQKPKKGVRFPSPAEYRYMAYSSIINGVKGLYFYCGSGQHDYAGKPSGILNKPEEAHWDYVKQLVGELRDFSPVIMAPRAGVKIELTPTNAPIDFTTREADGKVYLIAANKSTQPAEIAWKSAIFSGHSVKTLFEHHPLRAENGALPDTFTANAVHIYQIGD